SIDRYHDEAQLRERLTIAARWREAARADAARLRAGIRIVDDRIFLRGIEVGRAEHQSVQLGLAVVCRNGEGNRRLPSARDELRDVHVSELHHDATRCVAQHDRWWNVGL